MMMGALVSPEVISGITDASTTRSLCSPLTLRDKYSGRQGNYNMEHCETIKLEDSETRTLEDSETRTEKDETCKLEHRTVRANWVRTQ